MKFKIEESHETKEKLLTNIVYQEVAVTIKGQDWGWNSAIFFLHLFFYRLALLEVLKEISWQMIWHYIEVCN